MKLNTIQRKKARGGFEQAVVREEILNPMYEMIWVGKEGFDGFIVELGRRVAEAIMDMEREERSGPEYNPSQLGIYKWVYQDGSIYIGDRKVSSLILPLHRNVGLSEDEIPASAKIAIYRVMQEALTNVAKHSQANHVSLSLIKTDRRLESFIKDNGIGFDPEEAIVKRSPWGGLGLLSMKERTESSGKLCGVESAKGKGTTVRASWPLSGNN